MPIKVKKYKHNYVDRRRSHNQK